MRENITCDFEYDWCSLSEERELQNSKIKIQIGKPANADDFQKESEQEKQQIVIEKPKEQKKDEESVFIDGEQNIDDSMMQASQKDYIQNRKDKNLLDLEQKKNKLLFDSD